MTTLYGERDTPIHRLNPLTKLVAMLAVIVIAFALPYWWVSALLVLVVVVPVAATARSLKRLLIIGAVLLVPMLLALVIVQGLTFPGGTTAIWQWWILTVTSEGLMFALGIGTRITALVLVALLLVLTTHPGTLMGALTDKGMSPKFAYIISSTLQLVPAFQERASSILLAQQARGLALPKNPFSAKRIRMMMPLIAPLVLGMFTDVEERSTAMEARAFGSTARRTALVPVPDSTAQRVARWLLVLLAIASIAVSIMIGLQ